MIQSLKGDLDEKQSESESAETPQSETAESAEAVGAVTLFLETAPAMTRQKLTSKDFEREARERLQTSPLRTERQQFHELYNKFIVRNSSDVTSLPKPNLPSD